MSLYEEELLLKDPYKELLLKDPEEELLLKDPEEELLLKDPEEELLLKDHEEELLFKDSEEELLFKDPLSFQHLCLHPTTLSREAQLLRCSKAGFPHLPASLFQRPQ